MALHSLLLRAMKKLCEKIQSIGLSVFNELGAGFDENVHQLGIGIELRAAKIKYLRETNIEIFYKKHPVGLDRPDFILFPNKKTLGFDQPVFLECKMGEKIDDASRQQLKTYLKSAPLNSNPNISNISMGILLHFQKKESFNANISRKPKDPVSVECWRYDKKNDSIKKVFSF